LDWASTGGGFDLVGILNKWRWLWFIDIGVGGWFVPVEINSWEFKVVGPRNWRWLIGGVVLSLGFVVIVLNIWRWLRLFNEGLGGWFVLIELNLWGLIVFSPNNWGCFVFLIGLCGFTPVVVLGIWRRC
jgi:hypothetical protein